MDFLTRTQDSADPLHFIDTNSTPPTSYWIVLNISDKKSLNGLEKGTRKKYKMQKRSEATTLPKCELFELQEGTAQQRCSRGLSAEA